MNRRPILPRPVAGHGFKPRRNRHRQGLHNYGFRYYHPELGRWISRDPIGEAGGLNLYGFVGNGGVNRRDVVGLAVMLDFNGGVSTSRVAKDDFGRTCCKHEMRVVYLGVESPEKPVRNQGGQIDIDSGHVFLAFEDPKIGRWGIGFYPNEVWRGKKGRLRMTDGYHRYNYYKIYWACPKSTEVLRARITEDGNKIMDENSPYPIYDILDMRDDNNTYTCTTWACEVLRDSGNTDPGLKRYMFTEPYDLARIRGMIYNTNY